MSVQTEHSDSDVLGLDSVGFAFFTQIEVRILVCNYVYFTSMFLSLGTSLMLSCCVICTPKRSSFLSVTFPSIQFESDTMMKGYSDAF